MRLSGFLPLLAVLLHSASGVASEPTSLPVAEGEEIGLDRADVLQPWLPPPFWAHRQYFLHEQMALAIGPAHRDYRPAAVYREATERWRGTASLGEDGTLVGYHSGRPFPEVACPAEDAGTKMIWNFVHRWQGFGATARFRYNYFDPQGQRPVRFRGSTSAWLLKHRPEPQFAERDGDVFRAERRAAAVRFDVEDPPEAAGTRILTYRYEDSFGPLASAQPEDTWIFLPDLRRVRKISQTQRSTAVSGTDFTFDDLFTFSGLPAQYRWKCLGEQEVIAPMNTRVAGYPYREEGPHGPSGFSYANDRWELRRAVRIEMVPRDDTHPYSKKVLWLDLETYAPLYSFAYDRKGTLWKIIYHNHRWSEDPLEDEDARDWYPAWEDVPEPRDLRIVSEVIVNVQTGTGNRIDFWGAHGSPPPLDELRRSIDVRRLKSPTGR